jgi:Tfp pilus assembly protein PilX
MMDLSSLMLGKSRALPLTVGTQMDGKSVPKSGVKAWRISQQKVAATALAASYGIQYPNGLVRYGYQMWSFQMGLP